MTSGGIRRHATFAKTRSASEAAGLPVGSRCPAVSVVEGKFTRPRIYSITITCALAHGCSLHRYA